MKKLKRMANYAPVQQPGKPKLNWKKLIMPTGAILVLIIALSIGLNFTRIQYLFGKKDPVATVNGAPVSTQQFKAYFIESNFGLSDLTGSTAIESITEKDELASYMKDSLSSLVGELAQTAKAKADGIVLTEKDLALAETARTTALKKYKAAESFQSALAKTGMTEASFNKEEKTIYQSYQMNSKLKNKQFQEYKKTIPASDLVSLHAKSVLMQLGTGTHTDADIKKAAASAYEMMKAGSTVDQVIKKYSKYIYNYEEGKSNGDLGWFNKQDVPEDFWNKVSAVKPGHFSDLIKNDTAYSIVYVLEKKTLNVDKLTEEETTRFMNSEVFKTWYDEQITKWRSTYKAYTYVNSFELK